MGNSSSSQREREAFQQRDSRRFSQLVRDRAGNGLQQVDTTPPSNRRGAHTHSLSAPPAALPHHDDTRRNRSFATFSRQISAQSIPLRGSFVGSSEAAARDSIFYEQHEQRPLVHMEDLGMRDAPITHITAMPMPRRTSIISRLGTRLLPRSTTSQTTSQESNDGSTGSLRRRLSRSLPSRNSPGSAPQSRHRLSILDALSSGTSSLPRSRRRRGGPASISHPVSALAEDHTQSAVSSTPPVDITISDTPGSPAPLPEPRESGSASFRRSRLSRIRRSLSTPLETLLATNHDSAVEETEGVSPPRYHSRTVSSAAAPGYRLPPLSVAEPQSDPRGSPRTSTATPTPRNESIASPSNVHEPFERASTRPEGPTWAELWTDRAVGARREARRMPSMLRGRSSRLIRRDDDGPLPRILHLAAAAIAAQLSGTPEQAFNNTQAIGAEGLDGSLANLFRTLQLATTATTDYRSPEGGIETPRPTGTQTPLNFLRVFRFVGTPQGDPNVAGSTNGAGSRGRSEEEFLGNDDGPEGTEGRFVTLVMVGVRSVPSDHVDEDALTAPTLDALLSLPNGPTHNFLRGGPGGLLRHADGRSRFPRRRRASMGGVHPFPANYDSQRHHRMHSSSRQASIDTPTMSASPIPIALSESPPGPHPPPSTPADPYLSAYSSGTTTPNRRPSSASAMHRHPLPSRELAAQHLRDAGILASEDQGLRAVQQRRRSESESARQRDFGAGSSRRNGVVEPDGVETEEAPTQGSRSWLIYVVGTNLSEDHPAFATPSLFTDVSASSRLQTRTIMLMRIQNPTYEDMLLLSSLLGPAKPPVASREDVASAPGVYVIQKLAGTLIARAPSGDESLQIASGERCLVCLSDYEPNEEVRQLSRCDHLFHRQCIDEVCRASNSHRERC